MLTSVAHIQYLYFVLCPWHYNMDSSPYPIKLLYLSIYCNLIFGFFIYHISNMLFMLSCAFIKTKPVAWLCHI